MSSRDLASLAIDLSVVTGKTLLALTWFAGALVLMYLLPLRLSLAAIGALTLLLVWQSWRLGLVGTRYALRQIQCDSEGQWWLAAADGARLAATLRADSRIATALVWLGWQSERGRYWVLVVRPQVPAAMWRRLQARLRLIPRQNTGEPSVM